MGDLRGTGRVVRTRLRLALRVRCTHSRRRDAFLRMSIAIFQAASRFGWRLRGAAGKSAASSLSRLVTAIQQPQILPRISYLTIAFALAFYACVIVLKTAEFSSDVRQLIIGLFAVTAVFLAILRDKPLSLVEKAALYVTATVLVYLDAVTPSPRPGSFRRCRGSRYRSRRFPPRCDCAYTTIGAFS